MMQDWRETVRERMDSSLLPSQDREQVIAELAAHLEERYQEARSRGLNDAAAVELTLQEVEDWRVLAANICRAKSSSEEDPMNYKTKTLFLPALASFASSSLFLLAFSWISLQPYYLVRLQSGLAFWFYVGWLLTQVICGALGAFLSGRAGGSSNARMLAGTFPAIIMFALWAIWIPLTALFEHNTFVRRHPLHYALGIFVWVLPPGFALLIGARTVPGRTEAGVQTPAS
jgi:hypothetical protein